MRHEPIAARGEARSAGASAQVMAKEGTNVSLVSSRSWPVQVAKMVRDYGFIVTVIAAALLIAPAAMVWVMAGFALVNVGFLFASIAQTGRAAWRSGPPAR